MTARRALRLIHLYPTFLNLYGDRGNIACLRHRSEARDIELEILPIGLEDPLEPAACDLIFIGGGQDSEQWRIGDDLLNEKGPALRELVEAGVPALTVCGGYQLMGQYYQSADGRQLPGLGVYDLATIHPGERSRRCIGNVVVAWEGGDLVGFENHGGRTYLGEGARALGTVVAGFGNNGLDGTEGCRYKNAFGTYIHGSLLPKNPHLADYLLGLALERKYGQVDLEPLDDGLEQRAHDAAAKIALAEKNGWSAVGLARQAREGLTKRLAGLRDTPSKRGR